MRRIMIIVGIASVLGLARPVQATLMLQYRADQGVLNSASNPASVGQNVAVWQDQSVNANNATNATVTSQPTLQSATIGDVTRPVVRFDGVDDFLKSIAPTGITGTNSDLALFAVVAWGGGAGTGLYQRFVSRDVATGQFEYDLSISENDGRYAAVEGRAGVASVKAVDGIRVADQFLIMTGLFDGSAHTVSLYINGVLAQTTAYVGGSPTDANLAIYLGSAFLNGTSFSAANVNLAEVRLYDNAFDATSRATVEGQLYNTWFGVPEPSTIILLGLGGLLWWRRRQ